MDTATTHQVVPVTAFGETRMIEVHRYTPDATTWYGVGQDVVGQFPTGTKLHRTAITLYKRHTSYTDPQTGETKDRSPLQGKTAAIIDGSEFVLGTTLYTHNSNRGRIVAWYVEETPESVIAQWDKRKAGVRCAAIKADGNGCNRYAVYDDGFCIQHHRLAIAKADTAPVATTSKEDDMSGKNNSTGNNLLDAAVAQLDKPGIKQAKSYTRITSDGKTVAYVSGRQANIPTKDGFKSFKIDTPAAVRKALTAMKRAAK